MRHVSRLVFHNMIVQMSQSFWETFGKDIAHFADFTK